MDKLFWYKKGQRHKQSMCSMMRNRHSLAAPFLATTQSPSTEIWRNCRYCKSGEMERSEVGHYNFWGTQQQHSTPFDHFIWFFLNQRNHGRTKVVQSRPGNELVWLCWDLLYTSDAADSRSDTGPLEDYTASYLLLLLVLDSSSLWYYEHSLANCGYYCSGLSLLL